MLYLKKQKTKKSKHVLLFAIDEAFVANFASCGLNRHSVLYECLDHFERLCYSRYYILFCCSPAKLQSAVVMTSDPLLDVSAFLNNNQ